MIWGVSAYTLEEYRGKGVNSKIIEFITNNFEVNGVIGFTSQTSLFYQKLGYNIFNFEKFSRHILVLKLKKQKK
jgi:GNAT superfamily N-acetyltransferase